ncbi:hypothetical protein ACQ27_gp076 [Klebsiella phage K64-1]|nr:hypothetical protein ACQ27_gp076 [Klebsiella phage K64-1]
MDIQYFSENSSHDCEVYLYQYSWY